MAKKRKPVAKLKSKKLEDRIAPGMVGGGIVDPGMMEVVDGDVNNQQDQNAGQVEGGDFAGDGVDHGAPPEGQYLDEAGAGEPVDHHHEHHEPGEQPPEEFNDPSQYDEFADGEHIDGDFGEEEPAWSEPDWVTPQADGSVVIEPPEGVTIDGGIADFPPEVASEELPLPEGTEVTAEGGLNVPMPEGTEFHAEANMLQVPGDQLPVQDVPQDVGAFAAPDGSTMIPLPDEGVEFNADTGNLEIDNHHSNELMPENVEIQPDGHVHVELPDEGVEYNDDGSIHLSPEAAGMMDHPEPGSFENIEFAEGQPDGSVVIEPPADMVVEGGIAEVPHDMLGEQVPLPEGYEIHPDGTSSFALPEGSEFNQDVGGVTIPEGQLHLDEVPEGIDAHINPDGSTTMMLQDGMQVDGGQLHMDNYWTNEITPDSVHVHGDGSLSVAMPEHTEFFDDGSLQIPQAEAEFLEQPAPEVIHDAAFTEPVGDGSYHVMPPEGFEVNPEAHQLHISPEAVGEHLPIPEDMSFLPDGSVDIGLPEGTEFNPETNVLAFPEGEVHMHEIPPEMNAQVMPDGGIQVPLQPGMEFNPDANTLNLDNGWVNEVAPENVEVHPDGGITVDLPQDVEYHEDGSFVLPEHQADFLENPDPDYAVGGPEFVDMNPDGSVTIEPPPEFQVDPNAGAIDIPVDAVAEHFDHMIPEGTEFNPDGTMSHALPEGVTFDVAAGDFGTLNFPEGSAHITDFPEDLNVSANADGSFTVDLEQGMWYDVDAHTINVDNYWANEITPDAIEVQPDGVIHVDMPHDTVFMDDGSVLVPEGSADFLADPNPELVEHGPDWVADNPDGSITVQPPEGFQVDPEAGTLSAPVDVAMEQFHGDLIPEEVQLNADGSMDVNIVGDGPAPEYDAEAGTLTFPEGSVNLNEIPPEFNAEVGDEGNINVSMPEFADYDPETGNLHIDNALVNEIAPDYINITPDGNFEIQLPEDTQYFGDDGFVISPESAEFMEEPPRTDGTEAMGGAGGGEAYTETEARTDGTENMGDPNAQATETEARTDGTENMGDPNAQATETEARTDGTENMGDPNAQATETEARTDGTENMGDPNAQATETEARTDGTENMGDPNAEANEDAPRTDGTDEDLDQAS